jgi:hypothetical protein
VLICVDSLRICDTVNVLEYGGTASVNVAVFSKVHHRTGSEGTRGGEEVNCF